MLMLYFFRNSHTVVGAVVLVFAFGSRTAIRAHAPITGLAFAGRIITEARGSIATANLAFLTLLAATTNDHRRLVLLVLDSSTRHLSFPLARSALTIINVTGDSIRPWL